MQAKHPTPGVREGPDRALAPELGLLCGGRG